MTIAEKIDRAIKLDRLMKKYKKMLDSIKADLQAEALSEMENKNIKYVQLFGSKGTCEAAYKEKFDIDNFPLLLEALGDLLKDKVTRKEEVKFDVDNRFKEALSALVKGTYARHDIEGILTGLGLSGKNLKLAQKKLKGDYKKDKALLASLGVAGDLEEELDAIRDEKNLELIERYFHPDAVDIEKVKKGIWIEESLSLGITYNDLEEGA